MTNSQRKIRKTIEEILGGAISLWVLLYLMPRLPFVTASFSQWQVISLYCTILQTALNILKAISDHPYTSVLKALALLPGMYSLFYLVNIFPFDFTNISTLDLNTMVRYAMVIALIVLPIAFLFTLLQAWQAPKRETAKIAHP